MKTFQQRQFDKRNSVNIDKYFALRKAKQHKQLVPLSKRKAKTDKAAIHKAKAWLCHKPSVSRIIRSTEKSKLDWR